MQVWNVRHAARWKYRTQKSRQKSPSGHRRTNLSGYIFATKARIDNRKNLLSSNMSSTCPHNMENFGLTNGWDLLASLGHPCKFQQVSRLAFVTAATSLTGGQPNFARCMAVSWPGTFSGYLASWRNFATCKIHFLSICAPSHKFLGLYLRN